MVPGRALSLASQLAFQALPTRSPFRQRRCSSASWRCRCQLREEPGMLFQAGGRVLFAKMQNGSRLCPAYQTSRCRRADCQCAAVLRSGRVCGGHHPGAECRDRRRISPADADELRPEPAAKARPVRLVEARQVVRNRAELLIFGSAVAARCRQPG